MIGCIDLLEMSRRTRASSALPKSVRECHAALAKSRERIESLEAQLEWFRRQMFGQKSEKIVPPSPEQPDVFVETEEKSTEEESEAPGDACMVAAHTRHKHGRRDLSVCDDLPIGKHVIHDVSDAQKICPCCGEQKKQLPSKVSYQVGIARPQMFRIKHEALQYGCPECCEAHVATASKPMELLERCMADASLLSHIAVSKYADHLPLHRQEVMLRRNGIGISRWTLCNWMTRMGEQLSVLVEEMLRRVRNSCHAHVDETTLPVLGAGKTSTSYVWSVVGGPDAPYTVYRFTKGRGRAGPLEFLSGFKGILQSDAYTVYEKLTQHWKLAWAACWAHVRRKFVDALKLTGCAVARKAVDTIRQLYMVERAARTMSDEERCALRQENAKPVIDKFFDWVEEQQFTVLPQSPTGKAAAYAMSLRTQLRVYLDHGFVGIDNNPVERALRPVVVGRKNWMFAGNEAGGKAAAVFYSLIESAKRHGLNVADYLEDVIRRLPSHPAHRLRELLPDQWKPLATTAC